MNVDLAMAALKDAEVHPDEFDMGTWYTAWHTAETPGGSTEITEDQRTPPCGTTACFAGFIAWRTAPAGTVIANGGYLYSSMQDAIERRAPWGEVADWAEQQLGITYEQALVLFSLDGIGEVRRAVEYLADSPDADPGTIRAVAQGGDLS